MIDVDCNGRQREHSVKAEEEQDDNDEEPAEPRTTEGEGPGEAVAATRTPAAQLLFVSSSSGLRVDLWPRWLRDGLLIRLCFLPWLLGNEIGLADRPLSRHECNRCVWVRSLIQKLLGLRRELVEDALPRLLFDFGLGLGCKERRRGVDDGTRLCRARNLFRLRLGVPFT